MPAAPLTVDQAIQTGIAYHQAGLWEQARELYAGVLRLVPQHPEALHLLGVLELQSNRPESAVELIQQAAALHPEIAVYHSNLGEALRRTGRLEEALAHLRSAVEIDAGNADSWNNLGSARAEKEDWAEAIACFERSDALAPQNPATRQNLALACVKQGMRRIAEERVDEAMALGERALALQPAFMEAKYFLSLARQQAGQFARALELCAEVIASHPDYADAHWAHAQMLLRVGRFEEGWREDAWRWKCKPLCDYRRTFPRPEWDGSSIVTVLAHAEQGFGDALLFLRYVLLLRTRVAGLVVECGRPLVRLIAEALGGSSPVYPRETWDGHELPPFDQHLPWHSLPLALGNYTPLEMTAPYVRVSDEWRKPWAAHLRPGTARRVGLAWAGSGVYPARSIDAREIVDLLRTTGIDFYGLQFEEPPPSELLAAGLIDLTGYVTDFADTAGLLAELDLVISIDTAIAHLAGAMGKPVWTLLPFVADWRWGLEREDTPWYPTMRLFRQKTAGDWTAVIQRVAVELRAWVVLLPPP